MPAFDDERTVPCDCACGRTYSELERDTLLLGAVYDLRSLPDGAGRTFLEGCVGLVAVVGLVEVEGLAVDADLVVVAGLEVDAGLEVEVDCVTLPLIGAEPPPFVLNELDLAPLPPFPLIGDEPGRLATWRPSMRLFEGDDGAKPPPRCGRP